MIERTHLYRVAALLACYLFLTMNSGCGGGNVRHSVESTVSNHAWGTLTEDQYEESGYALYTYVIFGRTTNEPDKLQKSTKERYTKLLSAITTSTKKASKQSSSDRSSTNIFYIPTKLDTQGKTPELEEYDVDFAWQLSDALSARLSGSDDPRVMDTLKRRPGPFLVSLLCPLVLDCPNGISGKHVPLDILYVDLSDQHSEAMLEVVSAYKLHVQEYRLAGVEVFSSVKLVLLDVLLDADDNIKLVKEAAASFIRE